MGRGGAPKDRQGGPDRKCIATGDVQPKFGLIRFVTGPDGQIVPDVLEKLPGRGIYVSADRDALEQVSKKGLFAKAARQKPFSAEIAVKVSFADRHKGFVSSLDDPLCSNINPRPRRHLAVHH